MRKKRSKKRSKWQFLRNFRKNQTDFKNNGDKMMVTTLAPIQDTFYVGASTPKGGAGAKKVRNCDFSVAEGPRYMEFGMVVTYKI